MSPDIASKILYEDNDIIVVNKPAGLAVESARVTEADLISLLKTYVQKNEGIYLVHRLDQVVGGILVFAKTQKAAAALSKQLTDGGMRKIYRAKVCGEVPGNEGELVDYLIKDGKTNTSRVVPEQEAKKMKGRQAPKRAVLKWKRVSKETCPALSRDDSDFKAVRLSELEIELKTGRHHQIRVQLSHAGMPIAGDRKYGAPSESGPAARLTRGEIALEAYELSFRHPSSNQLMTFHL